MKTFFVTGVTGTLGKEFVRNILANGDERLIVLVRRSKRLSHWDRMRKILSSFGLENHLGTRIQVFEGDITRPEMGLTPEDVNFLRKNVDEFFHIAALTALNGSEEDCQTINFGGTQNALKFAWDFYKNGKMKRFFYFSTAYASGSRQTYCAKEDELPKHPMHANFYESSKFAAETKVREALAAGLPATIFRPSIVVGDSRTGEVSEFNVIYPFMKLFAHGMISVLPTHPENSFNIVPIDFVIHASREIAKQPSSVGKTFHLVTQNPPTIDMLLQVKNEDYPTLPPVNMIAPETFKKETLDPMGQSVYQILEPYLGYLNDHLTFDTANTQTALRGTGIQFPKTDKTFLKTLLDYAVSSGYLVVNA